MSTELATADSQIFVGKNFQAGSTIKNTTTLTINFDTPFATIPIVVITPFWPNGPVGAWETVTSVSTSQFTVSSANMAANYSVNWIACAG